MRLTILVALLISGCASTRQYEPTVNTQSSVLAPQLPVVVQNSYNSKYRKTIEILVVSNCIRRHQSGTVTNINVVESTETGERFEINTCLGKKGDRFKVAY